MYFAFGLLVISGGRPAFRADTELLRMDGYLRRPKAGSLYGTFIQWHKRLCCTSNRQCTSLAICAKALRLAVNLFEASPSMHCDICLRPPNSE